MEQSLYGLAVFMHKFKILNRMGFILNILEAKWETRLALTSSSENVIRIRLITVRQRYFCLIKHLLKKNIVSIFLFSKVKILFRRLRCHNITIYYLHPKTRVEDYCSGLNGIGGSASQILVRRYYKLSKCVTEGQYAKTQQQ